MNTLEQQVQRLTDIEDIKQLKLRYAFFCDDNYNPDGLASCFTEDGLSNILSVISAIPDCVFFAEGEVALFSSLPILGDLHQHRTHQSQT